MADLVVLRPHNALRRAAFPCAKRFAQPERQCFAAREGDASRPGSWRLSSNERAGEALSEETAEALGRSRRRVERRARFLFMVGSMVGIMVIQPVFTQMPEPREKLSISLPESTVLFVEQYRKSYSIGTRSEVIDIAVRSLFERELERAYAEAASEEEQFSAFESTSADGLEDDSAW